MDIIQDKKRIIIRTVVHILIFILVIGFFVILTTMIAGKSKIEGVELTYESLRRAAVQCYALEGVYPTDLDYLKTHYGLRPDERKYAVYYEYIASNLMPDITVLPRGDDPEF
jgi:hypothetical protein